MRGQGKSALRTRAGGEGLVEKEQPMGSGGGHPSKHYNSVIILYYNPRLYISLSLMHLKQSYTARGATSV